MKNYNLESYLQNKKKETFIFMKIHSAKCNYREFIDKQEKNKYTKRNY